jgi:hypothetical protein
MARKTKAALHIEQLQSQRADLVARFERENETRLRVFEGECRALDHAIKVAKGEPVVGAKDIRLVEAV